jgi:hypothetical protein
MGRRGRQGVVAAGMGQRPGAKKVKMHEKVIANTAYDD